MQKILVTTDLSDNSKAGIRFAIQLASQMNIALTFFYVHQVWRANTWDDVSAEPFVQGEKEELTDEFSLFIKNIYKSLKTKPGKYKCVIHYSVKVVDSIIDYAEENKYNYICIATHGAGVIKRMMGTNTGRLITHSKIPVLCIPKNYRRRPLTQILYASDGKAYKKELNKVIALAKPLNATVDMLHLTYAFEPVPDKKLAEPVLERQLKYPVDIHYEKRDIDMSVLDQVERAVNKLRPSLLVMFTSSQRNFFEKILLSSKAEEFSFYTKIPLLVFNKE